jgi:hypothetical protein
VSMKPALLIALWLALGLVAPGLVRAQSEPPAAGFGPPRSVPEYTMKAHYLVQLMQYTQWPAEATPSGAPLHLCILGSAPFERADMQRLQQKSVQGNALKVMVIQGLSLVRQCHLLFVPEREAAHIDAINRQIGNAAVLTVSESQVGPEAAVVLSLEGSRLVFDINQTRLRKAGLALSSKVMQLARSVTH